MKNLITAICITALALSSGLTAHAVEILDRDYIESEIWEEVWLGKSDNGTDFPEASYKGISSDSYTTNNNNTITLNGVTVMANNPEEFIAQMEDIADERFKENFPSAMNQFGRDLKRYQMNHSF